jgi:hypothetical protein
MRGLLESALMANTDTGKPSTLVRSAIISLSLGETSVMAKRSTQRPAPFFPK